MRRSKSTTFAVFFLLIGVAQTIVIAVLPIEALAVVGDARGVSVVYFGVGVASFFGRLAIPALTALLGRIAVVVLGVAVLCLAAALLVAGTVPGLVIGLVLTVFAFACCEVVLQLYVLDH